jgi:cAMP phosphodiesterase
MLPSSFDENGFASARQHLPCFVINDSIALDAGSLAMAASDFQRQNIRDIILTHAHLDHIAGLPLFVDDLFAHLEKPICVYATGEVIEALEKHIFNWEIYPRFSELCNNQCRIMEYQKFVAGTQFVVKNLRVEAVEVNHKVPTVGLIFSDGSTTLAMSGDTAKMDGFWTRINELDASPDAVFIECAFPDDLSELAEISHHLTPSALRREIGKLRHRNCPIYIINLKPMYRESIIEQIRRLEIENLHILEVGKVYEW